LLQAVLDGKINPGKVFTKSFKLDDVQDAYAAMDKREAIKYGSKRELPIRVVPLLFINFDRAKMGF
jgi:hypothetical protein